MRTMHPKVLSIALSIPSALILAPLLMNLPWLHYFMGYSLYSHYENVFLLTAISVYGLAQLVIFRLQKAIGERCYTVWLFMWYRLRQC